ncbi:Mitochondrial fission process protein 1 [Lamellibrachia satsuma]|nr:Mitochondrial fission process protein 1 [Lamellibrachia satsuma]
MEEGYANEVGESLRALVPVSVVRLSYVISCSYVCADACSKGIKTSKLPWSSDSEKTKRVTASVLDTLVWQGLASVAVPGFTINRICWLTGQALQRSTAVPAQTRKWVMLGTGLAAIPFIIKPIDQATDWALDRTLRRVPGMTHDDL